MIKAILSGLLKFLGVIIGVVTAPIDLLLVGFLPEGFTSAISSFNYVIVNWLAKVGNFAIAVLPSRSLDLFYIYIGLSLFLFTLSISVKSIVYVWKIIQKLKLW